MAILVALMGSAVAQERVRVRWLPATGGPVDGYVVHVRLANEPLYPEPRDVGLPTANPDGSLEVPIDGLDPNASYVIAVSAYGSGGTRSERSNELALLPRLGLCVSRDEGDRCDPCLFGTCAGGACVVAQDVAPLPGTALTARLVANRRRLRGAGDFVPRGSVNPEVVGATVELVGADGAVLHRAELPPDGFRAGKHDQAFRYVAGRGAPGGVRRLVLRRRGEVLKVRLRAHARVSFARAVEPLAWIVHVGPWCVRDIDLRCRTRGSRVRCG